MNRKKPPPHPPLVLSEDEPEQFETKLRDFHCTRKTPFLHTPVLFGKRVDFLRLYNTVASLGGFRRVSDNHQWYLVLEATGFRRYCVNAELAIRQVYQRFLEPFERWQMQANSDDSSTAAAEDSLLDEGESVLARFRSRGQGSEPAQTYNLQNHLLPPHLRAQWNLSVDLVDIDDYQLLEKALLCGLPNELDFAVNTCLLMSHQPGGLQLPKNPRILELLVAHVGVFDHGSRSYYPLMTKWQSQSRVNMLRFWHESIWDAELHHLLRPDCLSDDEVSAASSAQVESNSDPPAAWRLFNLTADLSLRDNEGQRVVLIATTLRNIVLDDRTNAIVAARSPPTLRLLLLCLASRHAALRHLALDALVMLPLVLNTRGLRRALLRALVACCLEEAQDRQLLIRGLELLASLACQSENAEFLSESLPDQLVESLSSWMLLRDLQLLLAVLEAVYRLSALGGRAAARLCTWLELPRVLLSLLTFEASQVGSQGIIGIKIFQGTGNSVANPTPLPQKSQTAVPPATDASRHSPTPTTLPEVSPSISQARAHAIWWLQRFRDTGSIIKAAGYTEYAQACKDHPALSAEEFQAIANDLRPSVKLVKPQQQQQQPSYPLKPAVPPLRLSATPDGYQAAAAPRKRPHSFEAPNELTIGSVCSNGESHKNEGDGASNEAAVERVLSRCVDRLDRTKLLHLHNGRRTTLNGHISPPPPPSPPLQQPPIVIRIALPKPKPPLGLLCEWDGCWHCCDSAARVLHHVYTAHLRPGALGCRWQGCDPGQRGPLSLLSHVQERHCTEQALQASLQRRRQAALLLSQPTVTNAADSQHQQSLQSPQSQAIPPPVQRLPENAARLAISRLASAALTTATGGSDGAQEVREGPVTRHIRLTAALALQNLIRAAPSAKEFARANLTHLAEVALSGSEAAQAVSQCLAEIA